MNPIAPTLEPIAPTLEPNLPSGAETFGLWRTLRNDGVAAFESEWYAMHSFEVEEGKKLLDELPENPTFGDLYQLLLKRQPTAN